MVFWGLKGKVWCLVLNYLIVLHLNKILKYLITVEIQGKQIKDEDAKIIRKTTLINFSILENIFNHNDA